MVQKQTRNLQINKNAPGYAPLPCKSFLLWQTNLEPNIVFGLVVQRKTTCVWVWVLSPNLHVYMFESVKLYNIKNPCTHTHTHIYIYIYISPRNFFRPKNVTPTPPPLNCPLNTLHLLDFTLNFKLHYFKTQLKNYAPGGPTPQQLALTATPCNNTEPKL